MGLISANVDIYVSQIYMCTFHTYTHVNKHKTFININMPKCVSKDRGVLNVKKLIICK